MTAMIPKELIEGIQEWEIIQLWRMFKMLKPDKKRRKLVEDGIKIKFPITKITDEEYEIFSHANVVRIKGIGMFKEEAFKREKEAREDMMREEIIGNYNSDVTESRI